MLLSRCQLTRQEVLSCFSTWGCEQGFQSAWLKFDLAFRHRAAANHYLRWDVADPYLWSLCFTGPVDLALIVTCFRCGSSGHIAMQCNFCCFTDAAANPLQLTVVTVRKSRSLKQAILGNSVAGSTKVCATSRQSHACTSTAARTTTVVDHILVPLVPSNSSINEHCPLTQINTHRLATFLRHHPDAVVCSLSSARPHTRLFYRLVLWLKDFPY